MLVRDKNIPKASDRYHSNERLDDTSNNYSEKKSVGLCDK